MYLLPPSLPLLLLLSPLLASAQTMTANGCLRLSGSVACPSFSSAWLSPGNLSNAFPFFQGVTDVASFDAGALDYFSNPLEYRTTQFVNKLGCTNSSTATLRYSRTVLCSMWVNEQWSIDCFDLYNATNAATGPKMVCQDTCQQYALSEQAIVNSTTYCPGPDLTNGGRAGNMTKDFVQCTNWTTLATNNSATCVEGDDNEGNCGFASSSVQLCSYCNNATPDKCCYKSTTDLTSCNYVLPALPVTTSSSSIASSTSASATSTTAAESSSAAAVAADVSRGLSKGQIAGIALGSIIGAILLVLLLVICVIYFVGGKPRTRRNRNSDASFAASPNTPRPAAASTFSLPIKSAAAPMATSGGAASLAGYGAGTGAASSARTMVHGGGSSFTGSSDKVGKAALAGAGAGAGVVAGRALLHSVRDENQSGEHLILTGSTVSVLWPYSAALPDELTLRPGMKLNVLRIYDDAWGTGQIVEGEEHERGQQGAFPLVCVTQERDSSVEGASPRSQRNSGESGSVRWSSSHEGHA